MARCIKKIFPIEGLTLFYAVATALYILVWPEAADGQVLLTLLGFRLLVAAVILLLAFLPLTNVMTFIRQVLPVGLILYWYPETYYINSFLFANLDSFFMAIDGSWFGCQPCLEFSRMMPWIWFSELMNFAYLSFYFIVGGTVLYLYFKEAVTGAKAAFIVLFSFFSYYIIFILIPVIGPQFYLPSPENSIPYSYPFRAIIRFLQEVGENPTGAFPSSHVGVTIVSLLLLFFHQQRKYCYYLLPIVILLMASTVYIKAHYLIDVFAGLLTAPLFYWIGTAVWKKVNKSVL
ncbi:MAG: phosphatase PAP2 family protein [Prevotellaceae bacterium]|jgi:membrane-associated phospholipid phosphatase|nr:phosphatase PAP2 family protein [Prevotellaceae bacterium]